VSRYAPAFGALAPDAARRPDKGSLGGETMSKDPRSATATARDTLRAHAEDSDATADETHQARHADEIQADVASALAYQHSHRSGESDHGPVPTRDLADTNRRRLS
jgi:hypothetical protein